MLRCPVCGRDHPGTTSLARALAGSGGDPATPALCWVCRRLHVSVIAEQETMRQMFPVSEGD